MTAPTFAATDDDTASLLDLLADDGTVSVDAEWDTYVAAIHQAADDAGIVRPNVLRPLLRGRVKPNRIGAMTHRAARSGLLVATGEWEVSDDREGRNSGKPSRIYRLAT